MASAAVAAYRRHGRSPKLAVGFVVLATLRSATHLFIPGMQSASSTDVDNPTDVAISSDSLQRRAVLTSLPAVAGIWAALAPEVLAAGGKKIVVFGGSGFVGSRVTDLLVKEGYSVTSVSRSSAGQQAANVQRQIGAKPVGVTYVQLDASTGDLSADGLLAVADAVISCAGVAPTGNNPLDGNGKVNVRIAEAASKAGAPRFVYISVSSYLSDGPGNLIFGDYLKGKKQAERAVLKEFSSKKGLIIRPASIEGAGKPFGPPGPPWVRGVSVDDVAKAAVAGALGKQSGLLDGTSAIELAAAGKKVRAFAGNDR